MSRITVTDLMVCGDCLAFAAGITEHEQGEPYPTDPAPWAEYATSGGHPVPTDGTTVFTSSRCQACGSTVAGSRHGAAWLVVEEGPPPGESSRWPTTDLERTAFESWQESVANGDTTLGFREWAMPCDLGVVPTVAS